MKQHISKEQWQEINQTQQLELVRLHNKEIKDNAEMIVMMASVYDGYYPIGIGYMIEFLGDDLTITNECAEWFVGNYDFWNRDWIYILKSEELADALWSAVKYKVNL